MRIKAVTTGIVAASLLVSMMGGPAFATQMDKTPSPPDVVEDFSEVSFAVLGDMGLVVGDTVEASDLEGVGVEEEIAAAVIEEPETVPELLLPEEDTFSEEVALQSQFAATMVATPRIMVATANAPVRYVWQDRDNKQVTLRDNIHTKIVDVHNLSYRAARATTQYPKRKWLVSGTKYNYTTPVQEVKCSGTLWWRKCTVVRTVSVLAGVDFRTTTSDGRPFGVTTTYCEGFQGRCPDFVKQALNI